MSEAAERLNDVLKQISADDDVLQEARSRRRVVLDAGATFGGVAGTYSSGSVAMGVVVDPVEDADGGLILDRRSYPELGPDGGGATPTSTVKDLHAHIGPLVRKVWPNATVHDMKRGVTVKMHAPLPSGDDPYVDVVVAMQRRDAPGLWIPNMKAARWDPSHPQRHVEMMISGTMAVRRTRARVVRLAKAWNKQFSQPAFNSFNLVALALESITESMPIDEALLHFFEHAAASIAVRCTDDPAGVSGPIHLEVAKDIAVQRLRAARDQVRAACSDGADIEGVAAELHRLFPKYLPEPVSISKASYADMLLSGTPRVRASTAGLVTAGAIVPMRSFGGQR